MLCSLSTCFPGSSSSALGLQSLGLSGQAPSSSSLDAGTLSDTTASGNCPQQGTWLRALGPSGLVSSAVRVERAAALTGHSGLPASAFALEIWAWRAQCCCSAKALMAPLPYTLHAAWLLLVPQGEAERAACRVLGCRAAVTAFRALHQSPNVLDKRSRETRSRENSCHALFSLYLQIKAKLQEAESCFRSAWLAVGALSLGGRGVWTVKMRRNSYRPHFVFTLSFFADLIKGKKMS